MSSFTVLTVLILLTIPEDIILGHTPNVPLRCQCISKETQRIGRLIEKVEVIPANSHCKDIEIIATLKKDGEKICLDPDAPWVKRVLERIVQTS